MRRTLVISSVTTATAVFMHYFLSKMENKAPPVAVTAAPHFLDREIERISCDRLEYARTLLAL